MKLQWPCGTVLSVAPNSVAGQAGMQPGDCLLAVNGRPVHDVIDVQFYSADEDLEFRYLRGGRERFARASRGYDEVLGLEFDDLLFDGIRRCQNRCEFCFVGQMPRGLRSSLYVRDDDYRLSFLTGSFVTLTNLSEADWERIAEQGLSPLNVSVHATDAAIRSRILGTTNPPDILTQLRRLCDLGVEVHTQVVLVPGVNDGNALEQTVADLATLFPCVASVSLVPVGLTRFRQDNLRSYAPAEAKAVLEWAEPLRRCFRGQWGVRFLYPSDEWYLLADARVPGASAYDGFPQIENGVGLVRRFLADWFRAKRRLLKDPVTPLPRRMTWVTGQLFAPVLAEIANWLYRELGITIEVVCVPNRFFGETVTVAGLLTGSDVIDGLRGRALGDWVILPRAMLDHSGQMTLDERSPQWLEQQLGARVIFAERVSALLAIDNHPSS
jgi:putative radical SAM enzyme (TIGR03279 family)